MIVYNLLLLFAKHHVRSEPVRRVLDSLSEAVNECECRIVRAKNRGDEDYYDGVADDESGVLESLVGAAFVVAQTQITAVVSSVKRINAHAVQDGGDLTISDGKKEGLMRLSNANVGNTGYTCIQVIDAMANYFKHQDEWTQPWSKLEKPSHRTAAVILAIGGSEGSTGNLRTGLRAIGISYDRLADLQEVVSAWAASVINSYAEEIRSRRMPQS